MRTADVLHAWRSILAGRAPSLSIEITRECPLRCPGCYAYEENHLGGRTTLRELSDYRGEPLVRGILDIADELKPLHVSLVGGDPLVRYRELDEIVPALVDRGIHVQIVTSAFRPLPAAWIGMKNVTPVVSIDGLQPEHDLRRKPATYERILKNIAGQSITIHCTVTAQMTGRPGYLEEFLRFWTTRSEVAKVWFSLFTPQMGAEPAERLTQEQRVQVIGDLMHLRRKYEKVAMPEVVLQQFLKPPSSPADCIFSRTTETISADLRTRITPCQFGGEPDCSQCGCIASMGLAAVGDYQVAGLIPAGVLFRGSALIGEALRKRRRAASALHPISETPALSAGPPAGKQELVALRVSSITEGTRSRSDFSE
jgi:MoaA/NifB/PqqE/SkfB family radical SAM enzyme